MMPARGQQGYVLITVLVALVLLTLVAGRLAGRVDVFRDSQGAWQRWANNQALLLSARDEVLFSIGTQQLSQWGFGIGSQALRVDGRPYRLPSGVLVSVQDARGLISLSTPDPIVLRNLLLNKGVADRDVEPLLDKLADYSDTDDLHRLNGAEEKEYLAAGLGAPRNDWPISPYEVRLVMGWVDLPQVWSQAGDLFTASRESWINPNTAPAEVLLALPGATPEGVSALLILREARLILSAPELLSATGILVPDEPVAFFPGRLYRLRLWLEDGLGAMEYHLILTPGAPTLPWQILEARLVDRPAKNTFENKVEPFPPYVLPATDSSE